MIFDDCWASTTVCDIERWSRGGAGSFPSTWGRHSSQWNLWPVSFFHFSFCIFSLLLFLFSHWFSQSLLWSSWERNFQDFQRIFLRNFEKFSGFVWFFSIIKGILWDSRGFFRIFRILKRISLIFLRNFGKFWGFLRICLDFLGLFKGFFGILLEIFSILVDF